MPSTVIAKIEYEETELALKITFTTGLAYVYKRVPAAIYKAFRTSGAKGLYFNKYIKDKYVFEKVG